MKVKAAAILEDGEVYTLPQPARHSDIIRHIKKVKGDSPFKMHIQGFVLDDGRFVHRGKAARIALNSGQIEKLQWPPDLVKVDRFPPIIKRPCFVLRGFAVSSRTNAGVVFS